MTGQAPVLAHGMAGSCATVSEGARQMDAQPQKVFRPFSSEAMRRRTC